MDDGSNAILDGFRGRNRAESTETASFHQTVLPTTDGVTRHIKETRRNFFAGVTRHFFKSDFRRLLRNGWTDCGRSGM